MNILRFNPLVWAMCIILSVSRYLMSFSPVSEPFKIAYNIAVFAMMYFLVVFETWRLNNSEPDWKELCEKIGAVKK